MSKVAARSVVWLGELEALAKEFPTQVLGVRGRGYLVGVQLTSDPAPYLAAAREAGLLAVLAGNNVIRLLPPLTATPAELTRCVEILRSVFAAKK